MKRLVRIFGALCLLATAPVLAQGVSFAAVPTVVSSGVSTPSPAGTANVTIVSNTLPANQVALGAATGVGPHASSWNITIAGHVANNANAKSVVLRVAGADLDSLPVTASTANEFFFYCQVWFRTAGPGTGAQPYFCLAVQGPSTPTTILNSPIASTVTFDPTVTQPFLIVAGIQTSAADIVVDSYSVQVVQ